MSSVRLVFAAFVLLGVACGSFGADSNGSAGDAEKDAGISPSNDGGPLGSAEASADSDAPTTPLCDRYTTTAVWCDDFNSETAFGKQWKKEPPLSPQSKASVTFSKESSLDGTGHLHSFIDVPSTITEGWAQLQAEFPAGDHMTFELDVHAPSLPTADANPIVLYFGNGELAVKLGYRKDVAILAYGESIVVGSGVGVTSQWVHEKLEIAFATDQKSFTLGRTSTIGTGFSTSFATSGTLKKARDTKVRLDLGVYAGNTNVDKNVDVRIDNFVVTIP